MGQIQAQTATFTVVGATGTDAQTYTPQALFNITNGNFISGWNNNVLQFAQSSGATYKLNKPAGVDEKYTVEMFINDIKVVPQDSKTI